MKIQYIITGVAAIIIYGILRLTHDLDLIIQLNLDKLSEFISKFPEEDFYIPPHEVIKLEIERPFREFDKAYNRYKEHIRNYKRGY